MIRITAKRDGFRRCGIAHGKETAEHADNRFTAEQLKTLQAEPLLVVEVVEGAKRLNVAETVKLVEAAETVEALDQLAQGEDRAGVVKALDKRRSELTEPAKE